ncbi:MAG: hypothetical protein AAF485_18625, partial [Chloroflexota bacterium]
MSVQTELIPPVQYIYHSVYPWRLVTQKDQNLNETTYTYDAQDRLKTVINPLTTSTNPSLVYTYAANGTIPYWVKVQQRADTSTSAQELEGTFKYNGFGQLIETTQKNGSSNINVKTDYNAQGLIETEYHPNSSAHKTTYTYDGFGRLRSTTLPDTRTTSSIYAGWRQISTDTEGRNHLQVFDAFGRLVAIDEDHHGSFSGVNVDAVLTSYEYNGIGELTKVTNDKGNETIITYNMLGQKIRLDDLDMGTRHYHYDPAGNLVSQVDPNKVALNLYYDALHRLEYKTYQPNITTNPANYSPPDTPAGNAVQAAQYIYDENGYGASKGQRTRMIDQTGTVAWHYDVRGRVEKEIRTFDNGALANPDSSLGEYTISYTYDLADRGETITYPDGEKITAKYNDRGLPQQLLSSLAEDYVTGTTYDLQARLTDLSFGNGVETEYSYYAPNQANQGDMIRQITVKNSSIPNLLDIEYNTYDKVGNIKTMTDRSVSVGQQTFTFDYDRLYQLKSATASDDAATNIPGYSHEYVYNEIGNIENKTIDGEESVYNYDSARPHVLDTVTYPGDLSKLDDYTYDANGNMISRTEDGITYTQTWDEENRLKTVSWQETVGSNTYDYVTRFVYDGDGNRLLKIEKPSTSFPDHPDIELTTVYISKLYEATFNTTDAMLMDATAYGGDLEGLTRSAGLAAPLPPQGVLMQATPAQNLPQPQIDLGPQIIVPQTRESSGEAGQDSSEADGEADDEGQSEAATELPEGVSENWLAMAQESIRQAEYEITWQETTALADGTAAYQAPNREQNLRTYFTPNGIQMTPRVLDQPEGEQSHDPVTFTQGQAADWQWGMQLSSYGYGDNLLPLDHTPELVVDGNRVEYRYAHLVEWYLNDERGLEQGFTLNEPPAVAAEGDPLVIELALSGELEARQIHDDAIHFIDQNGAMALHYSDLYAFDATGRDLSVRMVLAGDRLQLEVDDTNAVYPVTIDPLVHSQAPVSSFGADWQTESNQADATFGRVASAGDVNGDGIDDIIISAISYDNGETNEGAVFVWYGSNTGLGDSNNPDWQAESNQAESAFGWFVASAGDVNGDTFDDIIVSATSYDK